MLKRKGRIEEEELRKEVVIRNKEFQEKYKKEIEEAEAAARYWVIEETAVLHIMLSKNFTRIFLTLKKVNFSSNMDPIRLKAI